MATTTTTSAATPMTDYNHLHYHPTHPVQHQQRQQFPNSNSNFYNYMNSQQYNHGHNNHMNYLNQHQQDQHLSLRHLPVPIPLSNINSSNNYPPSAAHLPPSPHYYAHPDQQQQQRSNIPNILSDVRYHHQQDTRPSSWHGQVHHPPHSLPMQVPPQPAFGGGIASDSPSIDSETPVTPGMGGDRATRSGTRKVAPTKNTSPPPPPPTHRASLFDYRRDNRKLPPQPPTTTTKSTVTPAPNSSAQKQISGGGGVVGGLWKSRTISGSTAASSAPFNSSSSAREPSPRHAIDTTDPILGNPADFYDSPRTSSESNTGVPPMPTSTSDSLGRRDSSELTAIDADALMMGEGNMTEQEHKRMKNREASRRHRLRRQMAMDEMAETIAEMSAQLQEYSRKEAVWVMEKCELESRLADAYERLQKALGTPSHGV